MFILDPHTYIIDHYNPSVRISDLVSYTTYVVCVNFIQEWRDLQFKVDSKRQIFWETFLRQFLFTLRVFARNLLKGNHRKNTFRILFWCLALGSNSGFLPNKPTHYLLPTRQRWLPVTTKNDVSLEIKHTMPFANRHYYGLHR